MTNNHSVWGMTGTLRIALVASVLLAPSAWVVQYLGAFPVPSVASQLLAQAERNNVALSGWKWLAISA